MTVSRLTSDGARVSKKFDMNTIRIVYTPKNPPKFRNSLKRLAMTTSSINARALISNTILNL